FLKGTPMTKSVFVSGVFDLLHSGHVAFFRQAAAFGDLTVAVGSDRTVYELRGHPPVNPEAERLFMVQSVRYVKEAFISSGSGVLDFEPELRERQPDLFIVTEDANLPAKRELCEELGIEYLVIRREPYGDLPRRSSTALRGIDRMPYRIDLCGGWLDQPYVSEHHPGAVITLSIEPTLNFNERSGMATSTRNRALDLWGPRLPAGDPEKLAEILFCYDNPPGSNPVSGAQDTIGIVMPGLNYHYYEGAYWPTRIEKCRDERVLQFVERALYLVPLGPRGPEFDVLADTHIDRAGAKALADATDDCWAALLARDIEGFGRAVRAGFEAQIAMFPNMMNQMLASMIDEYRDTALGWKVSGAGGGGYLILVADHEIEGGFQILARRGMS
ncbi:MAG: adenylyltransferase/cytidyltransferase family protein, partial [Anaerolineae bacterium]